MKQLCIKAVLLLILSPIVLASTNSPDLSLEQALNDPYILSEMKSISSKRKVRDSVGPVTSGENVLKRTSVPSDSSVSSVMDIKTLGSKYSEMKLDEIREHLKRLGESKTDPIKEHMGWNFLHEAVYTDNIPLAQILLSEFDFNPNFWDPYFGSPMYVVQSLDMANLLVEFHGNLYDQRPCSLYASVLDSARARRKYSIIISSEPLQNRLDSLFSELRFSQNGKTAVQFVANRENIFEKALANISSRTIIHRAALSVKFKDEEGQDCGGLSSEFINLIKNEIISRGKILSFSNRSDGFYEFLPDRNLPASEQEELNNEVKLFGYIFGLSIYHRVPLNIKFAPIIYYIACGLNPRSDINFMEILRYTDPIFYNSQLQLIELPVEDVLDQSFPVDSRDRFRRWKKSRGNLKGYADLKEFLPLEAKNQVYSKYQNSINNFRQGINFAINLDVISEYINPKELEVVIQGETDYTAQKWREACHEPEHDAKYNEQYEWFWRAIDDMTREQRALLLKFVFALDSLPIGGFSALPDEKPHVLFYDMPDYTDHMPQSSTCFYKITLYPASSYEKMKENLIKAAEFGSTGFGIA